MRRARTYGEGGRGLLLVAQLAAARGTRQTAQGKTIWAEQTLPVNPTGNLGLYEGLGEQVVSQVAPSGR